LKVTGTGQAKLGDELISATANAVIAAMNRVRMVRAVLVHKDETKKI
jgi:hypothetical protein